MDSVKKIRLNNVYEYLDSLVQTPKSFYLINIKFMGELGAELKSKEVGERVYLKNLKITRDYANKYLDSKDKRNRKEALSYFDSFLRNFRSNLLDEMARLDNYEIPFYE